MSPIHIRNATHQDIDALTGLLEQLFAVEADFTFDPDRHRRGLALMLDGCGKHRAVKLAEVNQEVRGMCTAQTRISTAKGQITAVLEDLVVDRSVRGTGIGTALLAAMDCWAKQRGIRHLSLLADCDNHPALAYYRSRGWQSTALVCLTRDLSLNE